MKIICLLVLITVLWFEGSYIMLSYIGMICSLIVDILCLFLNYCRIIDQSSNVEIASFPIYKVLFCARGHDGTAESNCFAFTESSHGSEEFQIHVFSCEIKEAVSIIQCSNFLQDWIRIIFLNFWFSCHRKTVCKLGYFRDHVNICK